MKEYRNDSGSFIDISAPLPGVIQGSAAWGDYDNDGDLDILLTGSDGTDRIVAIYRNDDTTFTDINAALPGVYYSSVAWGDYDNDSDLDILLTGQDASNQRRAGVYRNDGGAFVDINAGLPGVNYSSVAWGDYDSDGDLDILLSRVSSSSRLAKVYRNDSGSFTDIGAPLHGVYYSSVAWGDYDNDGDLDILLTGLTSSNAISAISRIYANEGGSFEEITVPVAGFWFGEAAWGDYDDDGDLDILLGGRGVDNSYIAKIYRNNGATANTQPSAPPGLAATAAGDTVTFSW